ncbi:SPW repeat protein [Actinoplanes sp. N902-109]|uniref:SPW repeat domain-containing protein n=1 Tax=Actinoplanes sp. (strain N902-109) TaxID=649831 RepID=UPI0003295AA8|nr:SPW repeat protein [Actinoplanes sp. N902-109]AGL16427.1 hypothetical protein L083_2917 [Actinoplanes sp. N902-109]
MAQPVRRRSSEATLQVPPPGVLVALTGAWLLVAPFALRYAGSGVPPAATVNDLCTGAVVVAAGLVCTFAPGRSRALSTVPLGLAAWLIAAPFVLRFGEDATRAVLSDLLTGMLLLVFATVNRLMTGPARR